MTPAEYRAKAALLLEQVQADSDNKAEIMQLALSYLRLADLAEKNAGTDLVYETPSISVPMQQQPQVEQQQQLGAIKSEPSEDKE
jgi:hypothetical protein